MTFEEKLKRLSEITKALETGTLSLEESVNLYQEGLKLSAACTQELEQAKLSVQTAQEQEESIDE